MEPIKRKRDDTHIAAYYTEKINKRINKISAIDKEVQDLIDEYKLKFWDAENLQDAESFRSEFEGKLQKEYFVIENEFKCLIELNKFIKDAYTLFTDKYNKTFQKVKSLYDQLKFDLQYLYDFQDFYYQRQSTLVVFNIETQKKDFKEILSPKPLSIRTLVVQLPNFKIFALDPCSGFSCQIDTRIYLIEKIFPLSHIYKSGACGCYYNNSVYIFNRGNNLEIHQKFDLIKNRWQILSYINEYGYDKSCITFRNSIIICYQGWKVTKYDLNIESISDINLKPSRNFECEVLFRGNSRVYAIEWRSYLLYESEIWNENIWRFIGKISNGFKRIISLKFNLGNITYSWSDHGTIFHCKLNLLSSKSQIIW